MIYKIRGRTTYGLQQEFALAESYIMTTGGLPNDESTIEFEGLKFAAGWTPSMMNPTTTTTLNPFAPPPVIVTPSSPPETMTLDDARLILGACLNMLGGSISFTRAELTAVNQKVPTIEIAQDSTSLIARMPL